MKDRIRKLLHSNDSAYKTEIDWVCAVAGGPCKNPRDVYHTTPDCAGMTASAYPWKSRHGKRT